MTGKRRMIVMTQGAIHPGQSIKNAWVGRRAAKNSVSVPLGAVGVVTGYTQYGARVRFPHDERIHTVLHGAFTTARVWPGQLRMWKDDGAVFQVLRFSGRDTYREFLWDILTGEKQEMRFESEIVQLSDLLDSGGT